MFRRILNLTFVCILGIGVVFAFMQLFNVRFLPIRTTTIAYDAFDSRLKMVNAVYDANFVFDTSRVKRAGIYLPRYELMDIEQAMSFARRFEVESEPVETDDFYFFSDGDSSLYVDRFSGLIRYTRELGGEPLEWAPLDGEEAAEMASAIFAALNLPSRFAAFDVRREGTDTRVELYDMLDGFIDTAHPRTVVFGADGELQSLSSPLAPYDRIASVRLKTMKEAYSLLPTEFPPGVKIDLKNCDIVFILADSVVQPAYRFRGKTSDGDEFVYYVRAALFEG